MAIPDKSKRKNKEVFSTGKSEQTVVTPRFAEAAKGISSLISTSMQAANDAKVNTPPETLSPTPPVNEDSPDGNAIPADIFSWMKGENTVPPARLAKMMADISNKMGYYIAYVIIQRMGNMNLLISQLHEVEKKMMNKNLDGLNDAQIFTFHSKLKNTVNDFLEFARRFSVESKDIIIDPERDELVNLVRSLDAEGLTAIKELLAQVKKDRTGSSAAADKSTMSLSDFEKGQGKL